MARAFAATEFSRKVGAKIPQTGGNFKKDVKNRGNELNKSCRINKSVKKTNSNEPENERKNVLKTREKGQTNREVP
jgi:hypothetical protein